MPYIILTVSLMNIRTNNTINLLQGYSIKEIVYDIESATVKIGKLTINNDIIVCKLK